MPEICFAPSRTPRDACAALCQLIVPHLPQTEFQSALRRLQHSFLICVSTCPAPLPSPGLAMTHEMHCQIERYLPVAEVATAFYRLYRCALTYPPILASTPFHSALSWSDVLNKFPPRFQFSANPARLLEALLADPELLTSFLFASFLPDRFYGGFRRYPQQEHVISDWLRRRQEPTLRCLDAACGTGEGAYDLARIIRDAGYNPVDFKLEGWTIEPLEVWAAAHGCFPGQPDRQFEFQRQTSALFKHNYAQGMRFSCVDLQQLPRGGGPLLPFDLIVCNGLLGGPIMHQPEQLDRTLAGLAALLAPGGMLLADNRFHGGWQKKCPQDDLRARLTMHNLKVIQVGDGLGGLKAHQ